MARFVIFLSFKTCKVYDKRKYYTFMLFFKIIKQVAVTKPITPAEIIEALRRYWSPQLDMTGPFNRWSMRKPHLKLLSL